MSDWHRIARVEDVPLYEGRAATIDGRRIAVFRTAEGLFALDHACPHKGGPLGDGLVAEGCVTCPLHGWRFDLRSGANAAGPGVVAHHAMELDGEVLVKLAASAARHAA